VGVGGRSWTRIAHLEVRDADTFIRLHLSSEESLDATPRHTFTRAGGSAMRSERLCLSDVFVGRFGRITRKRIEAIVLCVEEKHGRTVRASCEPTRQFFAGHDAATIVTHNYTCSS